ncbi:PTS sugar transporter subunit IIB [Thermovenabulum gondwanense]|uniref:Fructose-specific phosphotransferase enzyme IIB component n=1 Tax=Thermovenabulum gondwanense TaxID=520767 RepID=A0A162MQD3_9FIRM|nr:PTS sugar transporter subunit IIB [Thermovenabulum gondwanense]KYO66939.1 Fructose-specific phosphotransferase enzyme IIB component [Thermovenabulum gondwanense]
MIKLLRVDDRLIHGQIITKWIRHYDITLIVAVDDETAKNPVLKSIATMAVPKNIKCIICKAEEVKDVVNSINEKENVMMIVRFPKIAYELINNGIKVHRLNIGNVSKKINSNQKIFEITHNIFLTDEEVGYLNDLEENKGVNIDFQLLPETPIYFWSKVKLNFK